MNREELYYCIKNLENLRNIDLGQLKDIQRTHPYFQTSHLLFQKALQLQEDARFNDTIEYTSMNVASRKVLSELLKNKEEREPININISPETYQEIEKKDIVDVNEAPKEKIEEVQIHEEINVIETPEVFQEIEKKDVIDVNNTSKDEIKDVKLHEEINVTETPEVFQEIEKKDVVDVNNTSKDEIKDVKLHEEINVTETPEVFQEIEKKDVVDVNNTSKDEIKDVKLHEEINVIETPEVFQEIEKKDVVDVNNTSKDKIEDVENEDNVLPEIMVVTYSENKKGKEVSQLPSWFLALEAAKKQQEVEQEYPIWIQTLDKKKENLTDVSQIEEEDDDIVVLGSFEEPTPKPFNRQDLIDNFIKEDPRISISESHSNFTVKEPKVELEDDFATETLARIYIRQSKYEKAINIFEKLSLKYPEKSSYFADQIADVIQLIENNKE